jgi:hypothetical protein
VRTTHLTSWLATGLTGVATVLGLLLPGVYPTESGTEAMLRGYDLVTLLVVVPGLVVALVAQRRRGSRMPADLAEVTLLAYLVYTYAYYVLGTGFADLMLLHAAVFTGALVALVLAVSRLDTGAVAAAFAPDTHVRPAAVVLGLLAVSLGAMWVFYSVHSAVTGEVPPGSALVESDLVVRLGVVLDLTLIVPLYGAAAVLLWRRATWGLVLGVVALVSGLLHQLTYVVALLAQDAAGVPEAVAVDLVEPVIIALYVAGAVSLLLGLRRPALGAPSEPLDPRRNHVDAR